MSATQIKRKARREAKKIINSKLLHRDSSVEVQFQDQGVAVVNNIDIVNQARGESSFEDFLDSDNDSVTSDENDETYDLRSELSKWASDFGISFVAFNALLCVLKKCNIKVPKDARTVLQTPTEVVQRNVGDGIYVHYGLKNALTDFLVLNDFSLPNIMLDFGIDGLPLFKSSSKQVWPILGSVVNADYVFIVGIFEGNSKPHCSTDFLSEFISELKVLQQEGLVFATKIFNVAVRCFVMDAPAKSFVLGIKGHTGYYSCVRCTQKGEIVKHGLVFPETQNLVARTNESFRMHLQPEHHKQSSKSTLENLNMDLIHQCCLDYMHVACLGVMRTLLNAWVKKRGEHYSLPSYKVEVLSTELVFNKKNISKEFNRKPWSLKELDRWKATELRQFALYTGPYLLKNILSPERYEHFLKFSLALRILLHKDESKQNNPCAENLLKSFESAISSLYDISFITCNFHSLLHLHDDAKRYGSLDGISAFKFENHLQKVKRKVKKGEQVASQIYKRQVESSFHLKRLDENQSVVFGKVTNGQISNVQLNGYFFSLEQPNNFCLVVNTVIKIIKIINCNNIPLFTGLVLKNLTPYFCTPITSDKFNLYYVADIQYDREIEFTKEKIASKIICLNESSRSGFYFTPLIN